jgi:RNA polymerase sigma factor (sigma-70 family)
MSTATVRLLLRRLAGTSTPTAESDAELLRRFAERRDEAAFTALVDRHGPLVLGVCRRLLWDSRDVEDAFQATFLVLARNASAVRRPASLAAWLYGVARRVALRARRSTSRQPGTEPLPDLPSRGPDPLQQLTARELLDVVDKELARLPEKYRLSLVLCALDGLSVEQTAARLGITTGAVRGRLERGRMQLGRALDRRGLTLPAILPAVGPGRGTVGVPQRLLQAAVRSASVESPAGATVRVVALADGLRGAVGTARLASGVGLVLTLALLAAGATLAYPAREVAGTDAAAADAGKAPQERVDRSGDPLPPGAVARLGTTRWKLYGGGSVALTVPPDGKTLLAASARNGLSTFDLATGKVVRQLPEVESLRQDWLGGNVSHSHVALSADGSTAFFAPDHGRFVCLADARTGRELRRWSPSVQDHGVLLQALLSADGGTLAMNFLEVLRVEDAKTGKLLRDFRRPRFSGYMAGTVWLALSGDGKTVAWVDLQPNKAGAAVSHAVLVARTGEDGMPLRLEEPEGEMRDISLSPDGRWLISGCETGLVQMWDVKAGKVVRRWPGKNIGVTVARAFFAPDSRSFVLESPAKGVQLIDVESGKERWHYGGATFGPRPPAYTFTPDGKTILGFTPLTGPFIFRFDVATGRRTPAEGEIAGAGAACAFTPDGQTLHALYYSGVLCSWNPRTGELLRQASRVWGRSFSPDGRLVCESANGNYVALSEAATGKKVSRLKLNIVSEAVAFSPDGKLVAVVGRAAGKEKGRELCVLEVEGGKELRRIPVAGPTQGGLAGGPHFSADGHSVFFLETVPMPNYYGKGRLRGWDVETGLERRLPELPAHTNSTLSLSPDTRTIGLMSDSRPALLFCESATGQTRFEVSPLSLWSPRFTFSPDRSFLLLADADGGVRVHDTVTGKLVTTRNGHAAPVSGFTWSPDGRLLATMSEDATTLIWDVPTFLPAREELKKPTDAELPNLWADLAGSDATQAYVAIRRLAAAPERTVPWLRERLRPVPEATPRPDDRRLRQLLAELDGDDFAVRERATRELAGYGEFARSAYDAVLAAKPSEEVRQRIQELQVKCDPARSPATLQSLRAVEVLEHVSNAEARQVLEQVAKGAAGARVTEDAAATLRRLAVHRD